MKSRIIATLFLGLFLAIIGCGKEYINEENIDCEYYDYTDCNTTEPVDGKVTLEFTISNSIRFVPYEVYIGNVDDGKLFFRDTAFNGTETFYLDLGEYSVKAKYNIDGATKYVVDGGELEKWSQNVCDSTCWHQNELNLKLSIK